MKILMANLKVDGAGADGGDEDEVIELADGSEGEAEAGSEHEKKSEDGPPVGTGDRATAAGEAGGELVELSQQEIIDALNAEVSGEGTGSRAREGDTVQDRDTPQCERIGWHQQDERDRAAAAGGKRRNYYGNSAANSSDHAGRRNTRRQPTKP